jgi:signal transduction histidine kinase
MAHAAQNSGGTRQRRPCRLLFALIAGLILFASLTGRLKRLANAMEAFRSAAGHGIPTKDLSHIFNRFYQLDKSLKSELGHSGLGLAITRKILELHDRTIDVASVLDSGTTFSFQLPVELFV